MERAVKEMLQNAAYGLLLDPGLGKTSITLATFDILKDQGIVKRMLVIAPLRVCYDVWPMEGLKWKDFGHLKFELLHGPKKEERLHSDADIFLINPEGVGWLVELGKNSSKKWVSRRQWDWPEMLVVDESTKFKHLRGTGRGKAIMRALDNFERRYILTGTPAPNGYGDLWGQLYLLDGGARLGEFKSHFHRNFFVRSFDGHSWDLRSEADAERIQELIADIVLRLDAQDYLDMPPLIHKTIGIELPPKARELYKELKTDLVLQFDQGDVSPANAGVLSSKLRQVANGCVYLDDDGLVEIDRGSDSVTKKVRTIEVVHNAKVQAVRELVNELNGQPLMVAYEFRHDLSALQKEFGGKVPVLGAGTTPTRGKKITAAWNRGRLPLLFAHPQSAGHGLNLQEGGSNICWYSIPWNLEHYGQLIARQWRQGQTKPVFVHHLVARNTIDVHVTQVLQEKDVDQKALLNALKRSID